MCSTLLLPETYEKKEIYPGKDPPDLEGRYIWLGFSSEQNLKKDFIDRCFRFPHQMYEYGNKRDSSTQRKKLKDVIHREYAENKCLTGYVQQLSRFIRATGERRHKSYQNNRYRELKGFQYYTIQFSFSSGLYECTSDVVLFTHIVEYERTKSTYWVNYPNHVKLDIIREE